jgi:hypothetical protein
MSAWNWQFQGSSAANLPHTHLRLFVMFVALAVMLIPLGPAAAQQDRDELPRLVVAKTARFNVLVTNTSGNRTERMFGSGAVIAPDRSTFVLVSNDTKRKTSIIQIGSKVYINTGKEWEASDLLPLGVTPPTSPDLLPELSRRSGRIIRYTDEQVRGSTATRYQFWAPGAAMVELKPAFRDINGNQARKPVLRESSEGDIIKNAAYKYDLWIDSNGNLLQENIVVIMPERRLGKQSLSAFESSTLITYYDVNDTTILIEPPCKEDCEDRRRSDDDSNK